MVYKQIMAGFCARHDDIIEYNGCQYDQIWTNHGIGPHSAFNISVARYNEPPITLYSLFVNRLAFTKTHIWVLVPEISMGPAKILLASPDMFDLWDECLAKGFIRRNMKIPVTLQNTECNRLLSGADGAKGQHLICHTPYLPFF